MKTDFEFKRRARSPGAIATVLIAAFVILVVGTLLNPHPVILFVLVLLLLPAVWDLVKDPESQLLITPEFISWHTGPRRESAQISEIDLVHLKTNFELSQRARITMRNGQKLYIPAPCMPPGRQIDSILENQGLDVKRTIL